VFKSATGKCTSLFLLIQAYIIRIYDRVSLISRQAISFFPVSKYCRHTLILERYKLSHSRDRYVSPKCCYPSTNLRRMPCLKSDSLNYTAVEAGSLAESSSHTTILLRLEPFSKTSGRALWSTHTPIEIVPAALSRGSVAGE
jgi:hypothetical protein